MRQRVARERVDWSGLHSRGNCPARAILLIVRGPREIFLEWLYGVCMGVYMRRCVSYRFERWYCTKLSGGMRESNERAESFK